MEKRCNEFTDALAKQLGKSGDDVRAAMKAAAKKDIEEAVDGKRLTRSQADRILSRIDDAACMPAFGVPPWRPRLRWPGDGGPGGPEARRFEHRLPPPGDSGTTAASWSPLQLGAPA